MKKQTHQYRLVVLAVFVLCGVLWALSVYSDADNTIRVPAVITMVATSYIAGYLRE